MQKKRNIPRSSPSPTAKRVQFELRPERAFVLHLDVRAKLPHRVVGRIEHVTSGQVSHVTCLDELMAFMGKVLRNQARGGPASSRKPAGKAAPADQLRSNPR